MGTHSAHAAKVRGSIPSRDSHTSNIHTRSAEARSVCSLHVQELKINADVLSGYPGRSSFFCCSPMTVSPKLLNNWYNFQECKRQIGFCQVN